MKILILKPSSLGDVIHALPVLRLLKLHYRHARIYWWIDAALAPLLENDPDLAGIVRFERQRWSQPRHWPEMLRSLRWLRAQQFDLVLDLQCLARSGAFAWLANGRQLIGLDEVREGARGFYDLAVPRASYHTHAVDWYLAALPPLGVPVHRKFVWLPPRPAVAVEVEKILTTVFPTPSARRAPFQLIALLPGARWSNKRWPVEHFVELSRRLTQTLPNARLMVLGGPEDRPLGEAIGRAASGGTLNLCGETTLPEMIEWVRRCDLLVTNDTGPMHVAAALNRPLVALFGPTDPRRTGPYGQLENVLRLPLPCAPCMKSRCHFEPPLKCLNALPVAAVLKRVQKLLAASFGKTSSRQK